MLAANPDLGKQVPGLLSVKTVLVDAVTGERPEPRRPLRNSFWYALVKSVERSEIFKSVVTSGSSDYWLDAEIASSRNESVFNAHGRSGLAHLFLSSVAEAVVRKATRPVLTIRGV
jgi:Universal stress protein family